MDTDTNITYYVPLDIGVPHIGVDSRGVEFSHELGTDVVAYHNGSGLHNEIARAVCFSNIVLTTQHLNFLHDMCDLEWNFDVPSLELHATRKKPSTHVVENPALKRFYATILFPYYMDHYEAAQKAELRDILKFDVDPVTHQWTWQLEAQLGWQTISSGPEDGKDVLLRGHYPHQDASVRLVRQGRYDAGGYTEGWVDFLDNIFFATHWRPINVDTPILPCPVCGCKYGRHPQNGCDVLNMSELEKDVLFDKMEPNYLELLC
jgi:hypothetical protein